MEKLTEMLDLLKDTIKLVYSSNSSLSLNWINSTQQYLHSFNTNGPKM